MDEKTNIGYVKERKKTRNDRINSGGEPYVVTTMWKHKNCFKGMTFEELKKILPLENNKYTVNGKVFYFYCSEDTFKCINSENNCDNTDLQELPLEISFNTQAKIINVISTIKPRAYSFEMN